MMSPEAYKKLTNQMAMSIAFSFSERTILQTCTYDNKILIKKEERDAIIAQRLTTLDNQANKAKNIR